MPRPFLTARWTDLGIFTYAVAPERLKRYVPPGLSLDLLDGQAFVSLVAFDFHDTRVLGMSWPGYRDFPELNLRTYVHNGGERGVVFLREFISSRWIAWIGNRLYNEHYHVAPVRRRIHDGESTRTAELVLRLNAATYTLSITGRQPAVLPDSNGTERFFKELGWGFSTDRKDRTCRYEVRHPEWRVYPVESYRVELDWEQAYGPEWADMTGAKPCSVIFAEGSAVEVYPSRNGAV